MSWKRGVLWAVVAGLGVFAILPKQESSTTLTVEPHAFHAEAWDSFCCSEEPVSELVQSARDEFSRALVAFGYAQRPDASGPRTLVLNVREQLGPVSEMHRKFLFFDLGESSSRTRSLRLELARAGSVCWSCDLTAAGDEAAFEAFCNQELPRVAASFPGHPDLAPR